MIRECKANYNLEFTIHFATINTVRNKKGKLIDFVFTIHFATINTETLGTLIP